MKARGAVMTGPRSIDIREFAVPDSPPPGGAIMRVLANGLCGSDYDVYDGRAGRTDDDAETFKHLVNFPLIPGHETVGRIERIDPDAEAAWGVTVGERVALHHWIECGSCRECREGRGHHCRHLFGYSMTPIDVGSGLWGGMADYMVLRSGSVVVKVPDNVSDENAALFNALGNGVHWTSTMGNVGVGDRVLVLGSGQRGCLCALVADLSGASQIITTGLDRDAHKLALAKQFGATHTVNVERENTVERVMEMTGGEGVDLVIDSTPGALDPVRDAIQVLRPQGTLVLAAVKGKLIDRISLDQIFTRELVIRGAAGVTPWSMRLTMELLAAGNYPFEKLHSHRFDVEEADLAIRTAGNEITGEQPIHVTVVPQSGTS